MHLCPSLMEIGFWLKCKLQTDSSYIFTSYNWLLISPLKHTVVSWCLHEFSMSLAMSHPPGVCSKGSRMTWALVFWGTLWLPTWNDITVTKHQYKSGGPLEEGSLVVCSPQLQEDMRKGEYCFGHDKFSIFKLNCSLTRCFQFFGTFSCQTWWLAVSHHWTLYVWWLSILIQKTL